MITLSSKTIELIKLALKIDPKYHKYLEFIREANLSNEELNELKNAATYLYFSLFAQALTVFDFLANKENYQHKEIDEIKNIIASLDIVEYLKQFITKAVFTISIQSKDKKRVRLRAPLILNSKMLSDLFSLSDDSNTIELPFNAYHIKMLQEVNTLYNEVLFQSKSAIEAMATIRKHIKEKNFSFQILLDLFL